MTEEGHDKIDMTAILLFRHVVRRKYSGMVLIYIAQAGSVYKRQLEQDLKVSQQAVNESIESLLNDELIKPIKSNDKRRKESYTLTPAGIKVAHCLNECLRIALESLPDEVRRQLEG